MPDISLIQILSDVGLSEKQSRVYLASLALGPARPTVIAESAGLKRTTIYPILKSLQLLGLMTIQVKGFKSLYSAEPPSRLDALVTKRHEKFRESLDRLSALPMKGGSGTIKHYEGIAAIRTVFNGLLSDVQEGDDYLIYGKGDAWYALDPEFFQKFIERRSKLPIRIKALMLDDKLGRDYKRNEQRYNLKTKIVPETVKFSATIVIIPQKVAISNLSEPVWSMVIENENIVRIHKELFFSLWNTLPD